jgi:hypothetical protein
MYNLTSVMWVKDETPYIPEWLEFHLLQGVDHFILYNDGSTDGIYEALDPYIVDNILEIREFPEVLEPAPKMGLPTKCFWVMDYCIQEQAGKTKWLFYHATDEFLFTTNGESLPIFLSNYDHVGALGVEWEQFSSSNHIKKPKGLAIENYTATFEDTLHHIKTIFRPEVAVCNNGTTHSVIINNGFVPVNERFFPLNQSFNNYDPGFEKIKLHHYGVKSREEFEIKQNKGYLDRPGSRHVEWMKDTWYRFEKEPMKRSECHDLVSFTDIVRNAIIDRYAGKEHLLEKYNISY